MKLNFLIIWKFTSGFNVSSLCFLKGTTNISPVQFLSAPHWSLEQSILHRHLIIQKIYWVVVSKSVNTGINLFDYTAQCYSVARRLLPSFCCVIWKYMFYFLLLLKVQWFWIMAYMIHHTKSLFSLISVISKNFENLTLQYQCQHHHINKWNALHLCFLSSVIITLITRYFLSVSLRMK